jgi:hypothetical protein
MARPAAAVPLGELAGAKAPAALGGASIRAGPDLSPVRRMGQQRMLLDSACFPVIGGDSPRLPAAPGARYTRRSAPLSRSASCPG